MRALRRGGGIMGAARSVPAVLLAVAGLTVLAACGGGQAQAFHPDGAQIAAAGQGSAAPTTGFAANVHVVFETPPPSQQVQAQVVKADQAFWLAFFYTLYTHGKDEGYLADIAKAHGPTVSQGDGTLTTGGSYGLSYLANDVTNYRNQDHGIQGTVVFSDTTVAPDQSASGEWDVSSCVNESQLPDTNASGQALPLTGSQDQEYYYQTDVLARGSGGRWLLADWDLVDQYPEGKAQQCMS